MSWARVAAARLRGLCEHRRTERDLDDEVRFHLEMQVEDNLRAGMTPEEARWAAFRSFGGVEPMKERYREARTFAVVENAIRDVRFALRTLRKNPAYTAVSAVTLALAIGASTAMFTVLNAVVLRPLPFRSPEQLAVVWTSRPSKLVREGRSAYWNIEMWARESRTFAGMAAFDRISSTLTGGREPEQVSVVRASPELFPLIGVPLVLGRAFSSREAERREMVAMISDRFWDSRFGGSRNAIGAALELDGRVMRIVGVVRAVSGVPGLDADVWEPHTLFSDWEARRAVRGTDSWFVIGRLHPGVSFEQAQSEMTAIERGLDDQLPTSDRGLDVRVVPLDLQVTGPKARIALWMLAGAVFAVLLIAATNVAGLSLARAASRENEIGIRAALGATRAGIAAQLLAESAMLAAGSGLLGLIVAQWGIRFVLAFRPGNLARLDEVSLDYRALGYALALCGLTAILVGLAPALVVTRRKLNISLQRAGRSITGSIRVRAVRRALVVAEVALAIMFLAGTGLLIRSLSSVESIDPGFNARGVLSMQISTPSFSAVRLASFYDRVLDRIRAVPGVESAGVIGDFFIAGSPQQMLTAEGVSDAEPIAVRRDEVSAGFFSVVETPLLAGRVFSASDGPESPRVAIVNRTLARRLWRDHDPVGRRVSLGRGAGRQWFTVVGVVGDMRRQGLEADPIPQVFEPLAQSPSRHATLLVRSSLADPLQMTPALTSRVYAVEKYAMAYHITTLEDRLGAFLSQRRFQTFLLIGFSVAALLIAATGIFGLIQYSITMRTHEIGIRMAVGAQPGDIFRMIVGEGLNLSLTGLVLGLVGALWSGHVGSSLLFGVAPSDPLTFVTVSLLLIAVGVAASCFPARHAMKVEPIAALRQE